MVRSKRIGRVSELTVVTPIKRSWPAGENRSHRQRLVEVLGALQQRIEAGVPTAPSLVETIHFARWFILENPPVPSPNGSPKADERDFDPGFLVFTSNFDGDLMTYLRDFALRIPDQLDDVWSNCEGYPAAGCRDFDPFVTYVRSHQVVTLAFVPSFTNVTVTDIQLSGLNDRI